MLKAEHLSARLPSHTHHLTFKQEKGRTDDRCLAKANRMAVYNYKGALINQVPDAYLHSLVLGLKRSTATDRSLLGTVS